MTSISITSRGKSHNTVITARFFDLLINGTQNVKHFGMIKKVAMHKLKIIFIYNLLNDMIPLFNMSLLEKIKFHRNLSDRGFCSSLLNSSSSIRCSSKCPNC